MSWKARDLTGERFGALTAIEPTDDRSHGSVVWRCKCDCGKRKRVRAGNLTSGNTRSCGCLNGTLRAETKRSRMHPCAVCGDRCLTVAPFEPDADGTPMSPVCSRRNCVVEWAQALALELGIDGAKRAAARIDGAAVAKAEERAA